MSIHPTDHGAENRGRTSCPEQRWTALRENYSVRLSCSIYATQYMNLYNEICLTEGLLLMINMNKIGWSDQSF